MNIEDFNTLWEPINDQLNGEYWICISNQLNGEYWRLWHPVKADKHQSLHLTIRVGIIKVTVYSIKEAFPDEAYKIEC